MAHNLNFNEAAGQYSFFSRKEIAWHGLGQVVTEAVDAHEAYKLAHLDYEIGLAPVYASFIPKDHKVGNKTELGYPMYNLFGKQTCIVKQKGARVDGSFATYRKDTLETFGLVGSKYEIVQNDVALDFIYDIIKNNDTVKDRKDIVIETAGALRKGEIIFVTAKLPDYIRIGKSDDIIDKYILFTTSHDGSGSIQATLTNIRVVCNNTLNSALNKCNNIVRFKHTKNVKDALAQGATLLNLSNKYNTQVQEAFTVMAEKQVTREQINDFIYGVFLSKDQIQLIKIKGGLTSVPSTEISANLKNKVGDVKAYLEAGVGQDSFRGSAYWLYNGVNGYLNNGVTYKTQLDKFESVTKGNSAKVNQKAFDLALTLI